MSDVLITFFSNQNVDRLRELVDARAFLESEMTALATLRATSADLDKLDELAKSDPAVEENPEALADADYAFHHEIARIAGNAFLSLMHAAIGPHVRSFLVAYGQSEKDRRGVLSRNRQLAAAIRQGDAKAAAQTAREHLQPCLKTLTGIVTKSSRSHVVVEPTLLPERRHGSCNTFSSKKDLDETNDHTSQRTFGAPWRL